MQSTVQGPNVSTNGSIARNQGLIYGAGIAVLNIILSYIGTLGVPFLSLLTIIVGLVGFFLVGFMVARQTGRVGSATMAGLWAGVIGGIGYVIWGIISLTAFSHSQQMFSQISSSAKVSTGTLTSLVIVFLVIYGLIIVGIGAGVGALGGLAGRGGAKVQPTEYAESPYPQYPPAQPVQPEVPSTETAVAPDTEAAPTPEAAANPEADVQNPDQQ